jgi:Na+/proline symporter
VLTLGGIGIIVFSLYMVLLVAIGIVAARYQRTSEDFWVAGRRFGIGLLVVAEVASVLHGGSVQGGVALAARFGGVAILPFISFAVASLIIVRFFAKKLRMMAGFTLPDYMGARFETSFLRGYSAVIVGISSVLYMIAQIRVMGFLLERLNIVSYAVALVGVAFFFPMLFGMSSPYVSRRAATMSSVAGSIVGIIWTVPHLVYAAWAREHAPWILDIHPVVPGLIAAAIPMLTRSTVVDMSPKAMQTLFPDRVAELPAAGT